MQWPAPNLTSAQRGPGELSDQLRGVACAGWRNRFLFGAKPRRAVARAPERAGDGAKILRRRQSQVDEPKV